MFDRFFFLPGHDPSTHVRRARSPDICWMTLPECVIVIVNFQAMMSTYEAQLVTTCDATHSSMQDPSNMYLVVVPACSRPNANGPSSKNLWRR